MIRNLKGYVKSGCRKLLVIFVGLVLTLALPAYGIASSAESGPIRQPAPDEIPIRTPEELAKIGKDPNYSLYGKYILMADLDLSTYTNWEPIKYFKGAFDGNGFVIRNLKIRSPSMMYQGLFGQTESGATYFNNIRLENVDVTGGDYTGALVGENKYATISNCYSTGKVTGGAFTGGLVGYTTCGIANSYSTASVTGGNYVGGLVGKLKGGSITDSYFTGSVVGGSSIGGLVGESDFFSTIIRTYSTGSVAGTNTGIGGLVGRNTVGSTIFNSYSTGSVSGGSYVGGLAGSNYQGIIKHCYSTGRVNGYDNVAGLTAYNREGTITSSYWDIETSGTQSGYGSGKTTAEMKQQATFVGWDFTGTWAINEGVSYPYLRALDNIPPGDVSLAQASVFGRQITVAWQDPADSDFDHVEVLVNGSKVADVSKGTQSYTYNAPSDGNYTITLKSVDTTGNKSSGVQVTVWVDTLAPQLTSITVNASTVTLSYNEPLDTSSVPAAADFAVTVDSSSATITQVSVTGSTVTLTLQHPVTRGNAVTVSYTAGSHPIRDAAGNKAANFSNVAATNETPDTIAPVVSAFTINGGASFTNSTTVTLSITASDDSTPSDQLQMRFSTDGTEWSAWEPYAATKPYTLPSGDGQKTVYIQVKDTAGNVSAARSAQITLDTTAPGVQQISVNAATLTLDYSESLDPASVPAAGDFSIKVNGSAVPVSGVTISGNKVVLTLAQPVKAGQMVNVSYTSGANPIRDQAGNTAAAFSNRQAVNNTPDTTPPQISSFVINNGAGFINTVSVTLALAASDDVTPQGDLQMRFSNDGITWSQWEPYAATKSWTLTSGDGDKTVFAQVKDAAGNISETKSAQIVLDTVPPQLEKMTINGAIMALDYTEPLDAASIPAVTDFIVQVNGSAVPISAVSVSGDKVNVILSQPVAGGQAVSASYTPGANPLRDLAGNQAAGFSNSPVINQTPNTSAPGAPVEDETVFWSTSGNPGVFEQATESGSQLFNVRYVRSNEVLLNLRTSATEVSYSVDGMTWLPFEPVQPSRVINLPEWEGLKTVYARLKDGATYLVRFVLDKTAPLVRTSWLGGATVTDENGQATMLLDVSDNLCPSQDLEVFVNGQKKNYAREIPLTFNGSGAQSVLVQVKDKAGNIGSAVLDIIN